MKFNKVILSLFTAVFISLVTVSGVLSTEKVADSWQDEIGATWAHNQGYTGEGVEVAIIDTAVDTTHPDFQGRVKKAVLPEQSHETQGKIRGNSEPNHATHICGIIGANGGSFKGVAPGCSITVYEAFINNEVLELIANSSAKVVNLSIKPEDYIRCYEKLLKIANSGKLLILVAGNNSQDIDFNGSLQKFRKLANEHGAIIVGNSYLKSEKAPSKSSMLSLNSSRPGDIYASTTPWGFERAKVEQASTGSIADNFITAPGTNIYSTFVGEKYGELSGTSQAGPMVAGAACLLWQKYPHWTATQIKEAILNSASPFSEFPTSFHWAKEARMKHEKETGIPAPYSANFSEYYGKGLLNIKAMFEFADQK